MSEGSASSVGRAFREVGGCALAMEISGSESAFSLTLAWQGPPAPNHPPFQRIIESCTEHFCKAFVILDAENARAR